MSNIEVNARDSRGEWVPDSLPKPAAWFRWPLRPVAILKFLFAPGGLILSWNAVFLGAGAISWLFLTPRIERMSSFSIDWIALIYLRNACLLTLLAGGLHIRLYIQKAQGTHYKYTDKWLAKESKRFLFRNQTWDNVFWNFASACVIWSGYEAVTLWAYANNLLPYVDWRRHPVYCSLLLLGVVVLRDIHFYWTHRISHWKPLYASAHYLHHKNVNIGPWSGLAMHPIEHLLYLSGILLHWIIPSHPIHAIAHAMHAGLAPARGHTGFSKFVLAEAAGNKPERAISGSGYFHYLHHRYFTVNFGGTTIPLDKWFGSWHDGSSRAQELMKARRTRRKPT